MAEAAAEEPASVAVVLTVVAIAVTVGAGVAAEESAVEVVLNETVVGIDSVVLAELERLAQHKCEWPMIA